MKKSIFTIVFIAFLSFSAFADIRLPDTPKPTPSPKQQKEIDSNLIIRLDQNATEATLIIPKSQVSQLRAQLNELDSEPILTFSRTQTIVSGLFLSLAIVFGGVWFSKRGKTNKTLVAGAVLFLIGAATTFVFANVGPPAQLRSITGKLFNKETFGGWKQATGKIKLKVADTGNIIELRVPDKVEEDKKD